MAVLAVNGAFHIRDGYWSLEVTRGRYTVGHGDDVIGQVRQGIDGQWYPELLPAERFRSAAVQRLILANEAMRELLDGLSEVGQ
jgi:hypothetical protein